MTSVPSGPDVRRVPLGFHVLAAFGVVGMFWLGRRNGSLYEHLVQEDRFMEWLTVAFFLAAAIVGGIRAARAHSIGDGLVALFCIAAAGEEVSWGQRFIGFTPPDLFLANNAQQEANLHNLFEAFGQPKWTLIALLVAYGIALPLATRIRPLALLAKRVRMTPPPWALVPWYSIAVALLVAYPVRFTGEWVEALVGSLFFFSAGPAPRTALIGSTVCALAAFVGDRAAGALVPPNARTPELLACAREEARGFRDLLLTRAPEAVGRRVHRRVWSVWKSEGGSDLLPTLAAYVPARCGGESADEAVRRRRYAIDPWGSAYWARVTDDTIRGAALTVYSFGPNRRRHVGTSSIGDDIHVVADSVIERTMRR